MANPNAFLNAEWKGRYAKLRDLYFKKRTKEREIELEHLINDAEYLIAELKRLERRARVPSLISTQLRNLAIQLLYWERVKDTKRHTAKFVRYAMNRFCLQEKHVFSIIYQQDLYDTWWIQEENSGNELDIYIPPEATYTPKPIFRLNRKPLNLLTRKQLIDCIIELTKELTK